jgi:hypothetical protein
MATLLIPTVLDAEYWTQKARLDGRDYVLHFAYNERLDRYYVSIHDDEDVPLIQGLKLVANFPLLRRYRWDERIPPGELMAISLQTDVTPPRFAELGEGRRVELTYFSTEAAT